MNDRAAMPCRDPVEELERTWPVARWSEFVSIVAVSSGADSVALLRALLQSARNALRSPRLIVAHFDHGTRGSESDGDRQFVEELAASLGLECVVHRAAAAAWESCPDGFEQRARELRYRFLLDVAREYGARHVVTAHTADDVAETVLFRIARGTGISGLGGIERFRELSPGVTLIRPWVNLRRAAVRDYLVRIDQPHREDRSNTDLRYARNRLRHQAIPLLAEIVGHDPTEAICRLARSASDTAARLSQLDLSHGLSWLTVDQPNVLEIDRARVRQVQPDEAIGGLRALWRRAAWPERDMTASDWQLLAKLAIDSATCGRDFPGGIHVDGAADRLRLSRDVGE